MFICSLDALKKVLKMKETGREKKTVGVLQQTTDRKKKARKWKIGMVKLPALTLFLLPRLAVTLTSAFAFIDFL